MTSISSNGVLSGASDLGTVQRELLLNFSRPTEIVFCQEPWFFGGLRHFQKEENRSKMNHDMEGLHLQEPMKISTESGILFI